MSDKEKVFLNLWRCFIRSNTTLSDAIVPEKCLSFVREKIQALQGLRQELLMHLMTLWETQLISSAHILEFMKEYDALSSHQSASTGKNPMRSDEESSRTSEVTSSRDTSSLESRTSESTR